MKLTSRLVYGILFVILILSILVLSMIFSISILTKKSHKSNSKQIPSIIGTSKPQYKVYDEISTDLIEQTYMDFNFLTSGNSGTMVLCPSDSWTYIAKIKNTGGLSDSYKIEKFTENWFDTSSVPRQITLKPNEEEKIKIPVKVPENATSKDNERIKITATSQSNNLLMGAMSVEIKVDETCKSFFNIF